MNQLINLKTTASGIRNSIRPATAGCRFLLVSLAWLALLPTVRAISPAPDGGYPNLNTAEGKNALFSLTTGSNNTATGFDALSSNTTGSFNTANGASALTNNTTGSNNTAYGYQALFSNRSGRFNTAAGVQALINNRKGDNNTAIGFSALFNNTTGMENTAEGVNALFSNTIGFDNTANGFQALQNNTTGTGNTAAGDRALFSNTSGQANTATGDGALFSNTTGNQNTATGSGALSSNTTGFQNTATGFEALASSTTGSLNTVDGDFALSRNTTGSNNIALGDDAGGNLTTGDSNIDIGNFNPNTGNSSDVAGESNTVRIGAPSVQTATFIAGISGVAVSGSTVVVNSSGQLGVATSSARFKQSIKPMDKASEAILKLKPVTFRYKKELDPDGIPQFGLVAEQVEKVNPDLVARDEKGQVYTVRYEAVNAMLLNEFLKEHRKVEDQGHKEQELEALIARQQKQIEALTATVEKVSDQMKLSKPPLQLVADNQ
jgi:trimeric autotransporter adhesin